MQGMTGISMFSSAGIAETYLADLGIHIALANELIPQRAEYYSHFYPHTDMVQGDIMNEEVFSTYINKAKALAPKFLLATPPCQGMSTLGKKDYVEDERNYLIFAVLRAIDSLDLDVIVIENVPKFLKLYFPFEGENLGIIDILNRKYGSRYNIEYDVYNAKDYGVPQSRPRAIIRLYKKNYSWPLPDDIKESTRIHKIKTLGNFTIITQSLNSSIGNNKWSVKLTGSGKHKGLKEYASGLLTLKDTLALPDWNEQTIDGRATWLAYKASILWPSLLPNDEAIEEPEFEEGVVTTTIVNEDEDVANVSNRDQTRYSLDGQNFLAKSYFVHEFVSRYIKKHPKVTFEELKTIFPDSLLESKHRVRGLLFKREDYDAWTRPDKAQRYGTTREGALLKTQADGVEFYVNTQWTLTSVQHIIAIAKEDGFDVMIKL